MRAVGLRRQDLNNRACKLLFWKPDSGRWAVEWLTGSDEGANIKPENLITEEAFQSDRAARDAQRSAAQRERVSARRAAQLERQEQRREAARAMEARAVAEQTPYNPIVSPTKPSAQSRLSPIDMVRCPLSRLPMRNAVLAADGYVYEMPSILAFWHEHGFKSPITDEPCSAVVLPHMPLRSLAREIAETPTAAKWARVPREVPSLLECPITCELMESPVRAADGQVYERESIEQWFASGRDTSPITNATIGGELREDLTLRAYCAAWA